MFFNDLNGKEIQTGGDITICVAESVQQRLTQYCKATKLQLKNKLKKKTWVLGSQWSINTGTEKELTFIRVSLCHFTYIILFNV